MTDEAPTSEAETRETPAPSPRDVAAHVTPQRYTQAEVDRIVADARRKQRMEYVDYEDLQIQAREVDRLERQIAEHERTIHMLELDTLRVSLASRYSFDDDDVRMFLTGQDTATLRAQAERLAAWNRQ